MALGRVTGGPGDGEDIVVDRRIVEQRIRLRLRVGDQLGDIERARFEPAVAAAAAAQQRLMGVGRQLGASCAGRTGHYHCRSVPRKVVIRWHACVRSKRNGSSQTASGRRG
jgi:hypothetical protein